MAKLIVLIKYLMGGVLIICAMAFAVSAAVVDYERKQTDFYKKPYQQTLKAKRAVG